MTFIGLVNTDTRKKWAPEINEPKESWMSDRRDELFPGLSGVQNNPSLQRRNKMEKEMDRGREKMKTWKKRKYKS